MALSHGHLNICALNCMYSKDLVHGFPPIQSTIPICGNYLVGKHPKSPYPNDAATYATQLLALVHTDLCSPTQTPSLERALCFLIFVDNYSRFTHIYFLSQKSIAFPHFIQYKILIKNQTNHQIAILRSDYGGEFCSNKFDQFCVDHGIARQFTNPYNPTQNGVAECQNQTLVESARSMLKVAQLNNSF